MSKLSLQNFYSDFELQSNINSPSKATTLFNVMFQKPQKIDFEFLSYISRPSKGLFLFAHNGHVSKNSQKKLGFEISVGHQWPE